MSILLFSIFLVLGLSALCSLLEASLFTVPINKVRTWVEAEKRSAKILLSIKESIQKPIAAIVILNNISNITGSIFVGTLMVQLFDELWVGILSGIFTLAIIIFAEIIPKTIGELHAESIALFSARFILILTQIFTPFLKIVEWINRPILGKNFRYPSVSEEEIHMMASLGRKEGILEAEESLLIRKALQLNDIRVHEIMTPRIQVQGFEENQELKEIKKELLESPFSRFPLFQKSLDRVTGLLYKMDALKAISENQNQVRLSELREECLFVPESKPIHKLMEELRGTRSHTAIVIDEYGGTAGLATLEDILEELVGDIAGEEDTNKEEHAVVLSEHEILISGFALMEELNQYFPTGLDDHQTVSKWILEHLNRFPKPKEEIIWENFSFTIEERTRKTIEQVRVKYLKNQKKDTNKELQK